MRVVKGTDRCYTHSANAEERAERARKAAAASAEVRKSRAEARGNAVEEARIQARLGVEFHIHRLADENDEAIAEALVTRAIANPDGVAMRLLLERRLGKVADKLELSGDKPPEEMDLAELQRWLSQLPETEEPQLD